MKRLVISGAGGFLGHEIIERNSLLDNVDILAITSKPNQILDNKNVSVIMTDEFLAGKAQLQENDLFIHCLFPMNADAEQLADGIDKAKKMIKIAGEGGVRSFINISSQRVYGSKRDHPAKESDLLSPQTAYAQGKLECENFCGSILEKIPHTNIRLSSLLGSSYPKQLVNRMIALALQNNKLEVRGGKQRYSYLDVRDAADAILSMISVDPKTWKKVYNLGNNAYYSLMDVAYTIERVLSEKGKKIDLSILPGTDQSSSELDAGLFMHDFNWKPHYSLVQSISDIIDFQMNIMNLS